MSILPKETIQIIAQSIGITDLPDDVASALAPDVEYRMREVMQEAIKCMLHSKRTILTTDDVNSALQLRNIEPLYGFASGGALRFKRALGHTDLFYIDDGDVDFKDVIESPLPKAPIDTTVVAHWLAIEGVQPAIPENVPVEIVPPSLDSKKIDTIISKKKDEEFAVEVKLPVKHVLSRELQLYFEKITELIITGADSALFKDVLSSLATDSGLHPLIPYFTQFIADEVTRSLDDLTLLFSLMRVARSLLHNPHVHIEPYLHQLMPSIITCLVAKRLGGRENHWNLRDYTANLIAYICRRFGHAYHNLQPRVTRTLLHAFLDPKRAMTQHYGAIKGLAALGPRVVSLLVLPNLEAYLQLLAPEIAFETQKNELKRYEAMRVYGTLLNAAGNCMSSRLSSCPAFSSTPVCAPRSRDKIATVPHKEALLPRTSSVSQLMSPRKRVGDGDSSPSVKKAATECMNGLSNPMYESCMANGELQPGEREFSKGRGKIVDDTIGKREKNQSLKYEGSLAEAWKEDVDIGPLLASLIELFGEGMLMFVPKSELSIFI